MNKNFIKFFMCINVFVFAALFVDYWQPGILAANYLQPTKTETATFALG